MLRVSIHLTLTSELALVLKLEMERKDRMEKPKIYLVDLFILASCLKSVIMSLDLNNRSWRTPE